MPAKPERTEDGHHIVVDGRRWRASDPGIPDKLRQELVNELMSARRAVRDRSPEARRRMQDAKVALGERGPQWWSEMTDEDRATRIQATILALLRHRDGTTICPSDVARVVGGEHWRDRMSQVRELVDTLADRGVVVATQRGETVGATTASGPIRIARGDRFDDPEG